MSATAAAEPPTPPRPTMQAPGRADDIDRRVDALVDRHPDMFPDPLRNPVTHERATWFRQVLHAAERAMQYEGVPDTTARRVVMRLMYGHPEGPDAVVHLDEALMHAELLKVPAEYADRLLAGDWSAVLGGD